MKALAMRKAKYLIDTQLIAENILTNKSKQYNQINSRNNELLRGINGIIYIEKTGPKE